MKLFRPGKFFRALAPATALALALFPPHARAQDVTVTPPRWASAKGPPTAPPREFSRLRVSFPSELRATPDLGYVAVRMTLDTSARRESSVVNGTTIHHEDAVREKIFRWLFLPNRSVKPLVATEVRCAVLFNPASAAEKISEATPRLLDARAVEDPSRQPAAGEVEPAPEVVWATVTLDEHGAVVALQGAPPALAPLIEQNARAAFRFAPARRAGRPVAAEVRVPFVVVAPALPPWGDDAPPRPVSRESAIYPPALAGSGLWCDVLAEVAVDRDGRVTEAHVVRTLNPFFDEAVVTAALQWKFEPARRDGGAVPARIKVPFKFGSRAPTPPGGDTGLAVGDGRRSKLPEELRYDVAPQPLGTARPVYPYELLRDSQRGRAVVSFLVGEHGRVARAKVDEATDPAFGAALLAAVERYEFEPALKGGRPVKALLYTEHRFEGRDDPSVAREEFALLGRERQHPERIATTATLDAPPVPVSMPVPAFPLALSGRVEKGRALVEVLVDEEGRARLPRVVESTDPAFGQAALQAAAEWRFKPMKVGGKPAVVRLQLPFVFDGTAPAAPAKS